ncbi:hypothetical protein [Emticicia sp. C21]|uniref:hypothetical protein n=1 Tax=Emticicia sp. C21 TaxID=2302915 RepID=UPI000E350213|nr:hypothetical protein [Emticicia sp. C21]RFS13593.1 hypothetical protein D0T08_25985 [Emticicia sp. C21]
MKEEKKKVRTDNRSLTDYVSEYGHQVYNYCFSGRAHKTLSCFFGIFYYHKEMEKEVFRSSESVFKKAIGYTYRQVVSGSIKVPTTQAAVEKVTNMCTAPKKLDTS